MKNIKVLYNQNKLYNEVTCDAYYRNQHDEFSIRLVFYGNEQYSIGQKYYNIYPGSFLVINEGTVYNRKIYLDKPANTFAVLFSRSFLSEFHYSSVCDDDYLIDNPNNLNLNNPPPFLETIYPFKGDMMYNLMHLTHHFQNWLADELLIEEYLQHCLFLFYKLYHQEIVSKSEQLNMLNYKTRAEVFKRLNLAKDYIISNYNKPITLEEISRYCCLSTTHLFRTFKQVYYCSPHQYLIQARLNRAVNLLKTTDYVVNEIVNLVGFDSACSFIRLFKNRFGLTPGNFRAKRSII